MGLRFWEELRSRALHNLMATSITASTSVLRDNTMKSIDIKEVVPGDIVSLSAGDLIPGDVRIFESKNLCVR